MQRRFEPRGTWPDRGTFAWRDLDLSKRSLWLGVGAQVARNVFGYLLLSGIIALVAWAILAGWRIP